MRRADRLFRIVQHLRGGRLLTARALAGRLEVSERTIYRDIADLVASGVPIDGEAGVGYLMRAGYDLPPLMFTREEVVAIVAGARLLRAWGGQAMARAAEEALEKIEAVLPPGERARAGLVEIHAFTTADFAPEARAMLDAVDRAVEARTRLAIAYGDAEGAATRRTIRPLGLFFWGRVWTVVAWCELRQDFRAFRIDRIAAAEPAGSFRPERGCTLRDYLARECPPGWP